MVFVIWLGLAIAVGFWADWKGRSGVGWGLLAAIVSPLLAAIIFFFVSMKDEEKAAEKEKAEKIAAQAEAQQKKIDAEAKLRASTMEAAEFTSDFEKIFNLKENNLLTTGEYADRKSRLIAQLAARKPREKSSDFLNALIPLVKRSALTPEDISEIKKYVY